MTCAKDIIKKFNLEKHIEGGYFRETYRSEQELTGLAKYKGTRAAATHIYHMLVGSEASVWHQVYTNEIWHHYEGTTALIYILCPDQSLKHLKLGKIAKGGEPHVIIPAAHWFAVELLEQTPEDYALMGCTVAPGFEYEDFILAEPEELVKEYPEHEAIIQRLARRSWIAESA